MTAPEPDETPGELEDSFDPEEEFEFDSTPEELANTIVGKRSQRLGTPQSRS